MDHQLAAGEQGGEDSDNPVPAPAGQTGEDRAGAPAAPTVSVRASRHRARRIISWVLVVIASVLWPLSVVTVWSVYTITNTNRYVDTLAPLARDKAVTDFIAVRSTDKLISSVHLQSKVADALPQKAGSLAAPITNQVERFVGDTVSAVLATEWFAHLWDSVNRRTHTTAVNFLEGKPNPRVEKARQVAADVTPVIDKAITALDKKGVHTFDPVKQKLSSGHLVEVPIATQQQVQKVQGIFNLATKIGYALPFIALGLVLLAVAVAIDRRKALLRCAIGASIGVVVLLAGLRLGRTFLIDHTSAKVPADVSATMFDTFVRYLEHSLRIVLLVALLIALLMWFIGPSSWARGLRHGIADAGRWVGRQISAINTPENRATVGRRARGFATWCLAHASGLRIAGAVVAGIIILFGGNLSPGGVLWTAVGLVIYLLLLEVVLAWARRVQLQPSPVPVAPGGQPPPVAITQQVVRPSGPVNGTGEPPGSGAPEGP